MKRTWEIFTGVEEAMAKQVNENRKRRLVTLFEANEVAKRIADWKRGYGSGGRFGGRQVVAKGGLVDDELKRDIIAEWMATEQL